MGELRDDIISTLGELVYWIFSASKNVCDTITLGESRIRSIAIIIQHVLIKWHEYLLPGSIKGFHSLECGFMNHLFSIHPTSETYTDTSAFGVGLRTSVYLSMTTFLFLPLSIKIIGFYLS
jgi:hypothetical protein